MAVDEKGRPYADDRPDDEDEAGAQADLTSLRDRSQQSRGGHGSSALRQVVELGAFAALDQVPPGDPGGVRGRPLWSPRFGRLVSAYAAEQQGELDRRDEYLEEAEIAPPEDRLATVGHAVTRALGEGDDVDRGLFDELFSWKADATVELFVGLPLIVKPWWILKILCCAFGYRNNTFGRLFPPTPMASLPDEADLVALSELMNEAFESPAGDQPGVPSGFVFFAQFVDHDLTLDATTRLSDIAEDPTEIRNLRTPALDLDNVYADGPEGSPELYDAVRGHGTLLVGETGGDLARNHLGTALIGDPRNDENTIVSQFHLHVLHFHNAVLRMVRTTPVDAIWGRDPVEEPADAGGDFEFARRMVRWHYQWALVNDWLPRIIAPDPLQAAHAITGVPQGTVVPALPAGYNQAETFFDGLHDLTCCGSVACRTLMPVEFTAAAFRFAHSQVRSRYDLNASRTGVPLFVPRPPGLAAFGPVPDTDVVEWERFFTIDGSSPQLARRIDTWLPAQVFQLPFAPDEPNLASRNLRRGAIVYALPSGDEVATALGVASTMDPVALAKLGDVGIAPADAPLWFHVLGEAANNGGQLGPVGGLLVAVTLLRLLECDEDSYVHDPGWSPVLVPSDPGVFTVADIVRIGSDERSDAFP